MKPFDVLIVWNPTDEQRKSGQKAKIVVPLKQVLATDDRSAMLLAGREIPESNLTEVDQMTVYVRPF